MDSITFSEIAEESRLPDFGRVSDVRDLGSVTALVVDDDPLLRELLTDILDHFGISSESAADGLVALEKMKKKKYEIVFMDWQMPNLDGVSTARVMRKNMSYDSVPIVAVTANSSVAEQELCLNAGMDSFVAKPYKLTDIKSVIDRWFPSLLFDARS